MTTKTDEPAFPVAHEYTAYTDEFGKPQRRSAFQAGMSLRDYAAIKAMQIVAANDESTIEDVCKAIGIKVDNYRWQEHWPAYVAQRAYVMADAMLAERNKS